MSDHPITRPEEYAGKLERNQRQGFRTITGNGAASTSLFSLNIADPNNIFITQGAGTSLDVSLPAAALTKGRDFIIKDISGNANSKNIRVHPLADAETIDGASVKTISTAYGVLKVKSDGVKWWTV